MESVHHTSCSHTSCSFHRSCRIGSRLTRELSRQDLMTTREDRGEAVACDPYALSAFVVSVLDGDRWLRRRKPERVARSESPIEPVDRGLRVLGNDTRPARSSHQPLGPTPASGTERRLPTSVPP
jgi:hypothetical protein